MSVYCVLLTPEKRKKKIPLQAMQQRRGSLEDGFLFIQSYLADYVSVTDTIVITRVQSCDSVKDFVPTVGIEKKDSRNCCTSL